MEGYRSNLGWVEVITGSMFSGKSEEMIRRLRRAQIARQRVQIFKPQIDSRYGGDHIVSHSDQRIASTNVANASQVDRSSGLISKRDTVQSPRSRTTRRSITRPSDWWRTSSARVAGKLPHLAIPPNPPDRA